MSPDSGAARTPPRHVCVTVTWKSEPHTTPETLVEVRMPQSIAQKGLLHSQCLLLFVIIVWHYGVLESEYCNKNKHNTRFAFFVKPRYCSHPVFVFLSFSISPSYKTLPAVSETFPTLRAVIEVLNADPSPRCLKKL